MAGTGDTLEFSVVAMIEDVLLEHGKELCAVSASKNDAKAKAGTFLPSIIIYRNLYINVVGFLRNVFNSSHYSLFL